MKEPKEYAKELVNKFWEQITFKLGENTSIKRAKQCALICVDEMYEIAEQIEQDCKCSNFLVDVEQEIKKL